MKKILILATLAFAGILGNAATFRWSASEIYSPTDSSALYSGTASLYCDVISSSAIATATITDGKITASQTTFNDDSFATKFAASTDYDFYFVITDSTYSYTSAVATKTAQATSTVTIAFGSQATATKDPANWGAVPEPTSGLLMLLGMAGLALRRRRA